MRSLLMNKFCLLAHVVGWWRTVVLRWVHPEDRRIELVLRAVMQVRIALQVTRIVESANDFLAAGLTLDVLRRSGDRVAVISIIGRWRDGCELKSRSERLQLLENFLLFAPFKRQRNDMYENHAIYYESDEVTDHLRQAVIRLHALRISIKVS